MPKNRGGAALQHYVPQLLLRGFANKRSLLYVFDKRTAKSFRSSVRNAGCERGFYDHRKHSDTNVDEWLKQVETEAGAVIVDIRRRGNLKHLTPTDREWLAAFIAIQIVRTKRQLTFRGDLAETVASALRTRGADPSEIPGFDEFDQDQLRAGFLDGIPSLSGKLFPYLNEKSIVLFISDRLNPCWISDHPAVRYNSLNPGDGILGTLGVASTGVEIYLPISSRFVLGFLCSSVEDYFRKARGLFLPATVPGALQEILEGISAGEPIRAEAVNIMFFNSLQVAQSERYLFAEHANFDLALEMLRDNPRFKEGPKPQVVA
jgi:hypothetical protein